jgi:hypothetical protein
MNVESGLHLCTVRIRQKIYSAKLDIALYSGAVASRILSTMSRAKHYASKKHFVYIVLTGGV